jgi:hypothetical protein
MAVTYDLGDLINKTIIAASAVPIYVHANDHASPSGSIPKGQPVGVLYSWLNPDPTYDRAELWFMFWPDNMDQPYYSKWGPGLYNIASLQAQGVMSDAEKKAAADLANKPWYEQLIIKYGPWVLGTVVVGAVIKGYFSRPKSSGNGVSKIQGIHFGRTRRR